MKEHKKYKSEYAMTGNVISNAQFSGYIRPYKARIPKDDIFPELKRNDGDLIRFDINTFPNYTPYGFKHMAENLAKQAEKPICGYMVRHFNGNKPIILGYFFTNYENNTILFSTFNNKMKQGDVFEDFKSKILKKA